MTFTIRRVIGVVAVAAILFAGVSMGDDKLRVACDASPVSER